MNINFRYNIRDKVLLHDLNIVGTVVGYYYGDTGKQYQVSYFINGEKRVSYFFEEDLSKVRKYVERVMGFVKND